MRAFCLSVHLAELVYSAAHDAGSGLAAPGLLLSARRGGMRAPRPGRLEQSQPVCPGMMDVM